MKADEDDDVTKEARSLNRCGISHFLPAKAISFSELHIVLTAHKS